MAKNSMTTLTITINAKQAEDVLEGMKKRLKETSNELENVRNKLNDPKLWGEGDTYQGLKDLEKQLSKDEKSLKSAVNQAKTTIKGVDEVLANISKASYNELTKVRTTLTNTLKNRKRETEDEIKAYEETAERLQKVRDEIAKRDVDMKGNSVRQKAEAVISMPSNYSIAEIKDAIKTMELLRNQTQINTREWKEFNEAVKVGQDILDIYNSGQKDRAMYGKLFTLATASTASLAEQKKYWQEMVAGAEQGSAALASYKKFLSEVIAEEQRRASSEAGKVMADLNAYSVKEIEDAIKLTEELQAAQQPGSAAWKTYGEQIANAKNLLDQFNNEVKESAMKKQLATPDSLSTRALAEQKKYWQEMVAGAEQGSAALASYKKFLSEVTAEEQRRASSEAGKVMGNLQSSSVAEIQEAIKVTERLRDAHARGSQEYETYNEEIKRATEYLKSYTELEKQVEMEDKWQNLATLSTQALSEQKKYWQEMVAGAGQGTTELAEYEAKLKAVVAEEQKRSAAMAAKVMADPAAYSVDEINQAIEATKKLQAAQQPGSAAWKTYGEQIANAKNLLDQFNNEVKESAMIGKLSSLDVASTASLAEQKKYWQEMVNGAEQGSAALDVYKQNLADVTAEEQKRLQLSAQRTIADIEIGDWDKTIAESKEAVKQLQQYRDTLKDTDKVGLEQVDKAIADLNTRIKGAQEGVLSMADALAKVDDLENFDGTIEDLEKLKKRLEEIRKTEINLGDADSKQKINDIDDALEKLNKRIKGVSEKSFDLDETLKNLKSASFNDLTKAAEELQKQIKNCEANSAEFNKESERLREVNKRLDELKKNWADHENVIIRTAKRLASYVLVYGGFNQIIGRVKEMFNANLELSDSMADVQKTSGLSSEAISHLSQNIDKIDTRSSQAALHELAAAAGQIGLRSEEDILGFVKASNMITVSLNELGSEGTTSLMKIAQLTGEIKTEGVEGSLMAIGSAINELSANSAATAGPIVDLMNRMGGIASMAKISSAEMAAIGATADALGQSMEITGTSMNKFITTVMSNSDKIAYSLNMDAKALRDLINSGQTMEAMLQIFERMNEVGGMSKLSAIMGDLGSEGARMTQVLTSLAQNTDFLRSQVDLSRDAFTQATSIQNEYNVKNENAIAILQRMGNTIRESFVNSGVVETLTNILRLMNDFVNWMKKGEGGARELKYILTALVITLGAASIKMDAFIKALFKAKTYTDAWTISWRNLGKALKSNWISLLIGLVTSLVLYLRDVITHISELTKLQAEYSAELTKEQNIMDNLFATVKKENIERNEKKKLLYEINKRYGDYIGFILKEEDGINKINAAYNLANARLRERIALQFEEKKAALIQEDYAKQMRENEQDLRKAIDEFAPLQGLTGDAMSAVRKTVLGNLDKDTDDIIQLVNTALGEVSALYDSQKWGKTKVFDGGALGDVREYIEIQKNYRKEINNQTKAQQEEIEASRKDISKANAQMGIAMVGEFDRLMNQARDLTAKKTAATTAEEKKTIEDALNTTYRSILDQSKQFEDYVTNNTEQLTESQLQGAVKQRDRLRAMAAEIRKIAPFSDAWGKSVNLKGWKDTLENIDTASVDNLVKTYNELRDAPKLISDVVKYNAMFGTSFTSLDQVMEDTYEKAGKIKEQLASMGRTTTGAFLWKNGGDSEKRKAREEYKAALSALDAYYKEREALIREQGAKEGALPTTVERNVDKLKEQWEKDKQELLKMLLGDVSTFNPFANEGYMGVLTQNVFFGKNRNTGYLKNLAIQLSQFGIALEDGMRNTLSTSLVNTSKLVEEEVEKMRKVLLQDDFTEQVAQQYMESLDTLGLLFGVYETELTDTTAEMGRQRLEAMRKYADESYNLTAEELQTKMAQSGQFDEWMKNRSIESYEVLLGELRKFHDDQEEADRKAAERRKKIMENSAEGRALTQKNEANIRSEEEDVEMWDRFKGMDLVTDDTVDRAQIDVYQAKIAASQAWIEQIEAQMAAEKAQLEQEMKNVQLQISLMKLRGEDTTNLEAQLSAMQSHYRSITNQQDLMALQHKEEIADAEKEITNRRIAIQQRTVGEVQKYTDALTQFAYDAAYAEEDADQTVAEARNAMIKSLLTSLKDWAQIKLTELTMNAIFGSQRLAQEGSETSTSLGISAAEASGEVAAATAKATAKEVATKGLVGLAVGAVIGAALNALLGAALGKLNKQKAKVESLSGAGGGKLATGMLTYAEGNYPVLGNDGKVYNAKYEGKGMKTGVYGGGAHFGIFSEKQPEAIIDGKTTQRLMLNYPEIWKSIVTLSRVGKIERGMRTFATGNIQEIAAAATTADGAVTAAQNEQWAQMQATLIAMQQTQMILIQRLNEPIQANINMYGNGGMYKSMEKAGKFAKRRGY